MVHLIPLLRYVKCGTLQYLQWFLPFIIIFCVHTQFEVGILMKICKQLLHCHNLLFGLTETITWFLGDKFGSKAGNRTLSSPGSKSNSVHQQRKVNIYYQSSWPFWPTTKNGGGYTGTHYTKTWKCGRLVHRKLEDKILSILRNKMDGWKGNNCHIQSWTCK